MAYHVKTNGYAGLKNDTSKYYVDIMCDTAADIPNPADHPEWEVGSELIVLENGGSKYRLSNTREWVKVNFNTGSGGGEKGDPGKDGYTPVRGVDYWTEADRSEIVREVIESLGGNPIFGYVDESNNIIVQGNLGNGNYSIKYEMEDGSIVDIGDLVLDNDEEVSEPTSYTNQIPLSTEADGTPFNGGLGYKSGYRLSMSAGGETQSNAEGCEVTGYIPANGGDILRLKNITTGSDTKNLLFYYNISKELIDSDSTGTICTTDEENGVVSGALRNVSGTKYIRFASENIDDTSIATINEEIV